MAEGKQMLDDALRRLRWRVDVLAVLDYSLCEHFNISDDHFLLLITYQDDNILESTAVRDVICEAFHKLHLEEVWQYAPDGLLDLVDHQGEGECENLAIVTDVRNRIEFMLQKDNEELENGVLDMYRPIAQTVEKLVREPHIHDRFRAGATRYVEMWTDYEEQWDEWETHRVAALKNPALQDHSNRPPGDDLVFIVVNKATKVSEQVKAWVHPRPRRPLPEFIHDKLSRSTMFRADHWPNRDDMLSVQYGKLAVVHDYVLLPNVAPILSAEARKSRSSLLYGLGFGVGGVIRESCQSYELTLLESDLEAVETDLTICRQDAASTADDSKGSPRVSRPSQDTAKGAGTHTSPRAPRARSYDPWPKNAWFIYREKSKRICLHYCGNTKDLCLKTSAKPQLILLMLCSVLDGSDAAFADNDARKEITLADMKDLSYEGDGPIKTVRRINRELSRKMPKMFGVSGDKLFEFIQYRSDEQVFVSGLRWHSDD